MTEAPATSGEQGEDNVIVTAETISQFTSTNNTLESLQGQPNFLLKWPKASEMRLDMIGTNIGKHIQLLNRIIKYSALKHKPFLLKHISATISNINKNNFFELNVAGILYKLIPF